MENAHKMFKQIHTVNFFLFIESILRIASLTQIKSYIIFF